MQQAMKVMREQAGEMAVRAQQAAAKAAAEVKHSLGTACKRSAAGSCQKAFFFLKHSLETCLESPQGPSAGTDDPLGSSWGGTHSVVVVMSPLCEGVGDVHGLCSARPAWSHVTL
jgi:hypothetical protein